MQHIALITGAGTGIGQALALRLASEGIHVYINGRREQPLLDTQQLSPDNITPIVADVSTEQGRATLCEAVSAHSQIHYLIHNAGTVDPLAPLQRIHLADWQQIMATNVEAPLFLTQHLASQLANSRILHISSGLAHFVIPGFGAYGISKAALYMMKEVYNADLQFQNTLVGSVMPGVVDTPIQQTIRDSDATLFPDKVNFENFARDNKLVPVDTCAKFLRYLLLDTSDEAYPKGDWDIYDVSHHAQWLGDNPLPTLD